ncbi:MAG: hypothetical protein HGB12_15075, partial [Bacteroidetes bacterium]|nr:hypothetical protein [Bacteroidota bacterium]
MAYKIPMLPFDKDLETKAVLKKVAAARSALAELKGAANSIPNENILISTLSLQEAKDSSAIENIITTNDELYRSDAFAKNFKSVASKEVYNYAEALRNGFEIVKLKGFISNNHIIQIQALIENNDAGFRKLPGTSLKNEQTGEIVYTPPQSYDEIAELMSNLEKFMNDNALSDSDPLVKMAIIHHQFESIHPFYDGNGRTGRIINILYLVKEKLLHIPILYLSRYINQNKGNYYRLLQEVRSSNAWEEWKIKSNYKPVINIENHDTVGLLAMDQKGNISGGCSTSGLAYKMHGRVGDSPIIGAGLYLDNEVGAAVATGLGELVMRAVSAFLAVEL